MIQAWEGQKEFAGVWEWAQVSTLSPSPAHKGSEHNGRFAVFAFIHFWVVILHDECMFIACIKIADMQLPVQD